MDFSVSVIIPTYNLARFLPAAIDSVLSQTCPASEVIVVDDASTDDTPTLMQTRYGDHPGVRYIRLEENHGPDFARNFGARAGSAPFLAFVDSDDVWLPHHLETVRRFFMENPDSVAVLTQRGEIDAGGRVTRDVVPEFWSGSILDVLLKRVIFHPSRLVLRKDVWSSINDRKPLGSFSWKFGEDYFIGVACAHMYGTRVRVIPERTVWMRAHGSQSYHSALALKQNLLFAVDAIFETFPELRPLKPMVRSANLFHAAYFLWRTGRWREGWQTLGEGLQSYPRSILLRDFWITLSRLLLPPGVRRLWGLPG